MTKPVRAAILLTLAAAGVAAISLLGVAPMVYFQTFRVSSASMENTLHIGDCVMVRRFPKAPQPGDIVVVVSPLNRSEMFVKRVIGVPGDHIRIVNRVVYRNQQPLSEPYAKFILPDPDPLLDNFPVEVPRFQNEAARFMLSHYVLSGELVVPPSAYFILGDNRENSLDDRFTGITPAADLAGKALFLYAASPSADNLRRLFKPF